MPSRRDFLTYGGLGLLGAVSYPLIQKILMPGLENDLDFINSNQNYLQINLYGGPSRWAFDSLLDPYNQGFIPNKMVGTQFKDESAELIFKTTKMNGLKLPSVWGENLAGRKGEESFLSLLDNSLFIRGVEPAGIGHPQASSNTVRPDKAGHSLQGLFSDKSTAPLSSVIMGNNPATRSYSSENKGPQKLSLESENLLKELIGPFLIEGKNPTKEFKQAIKLVSSSKNQNYRSSLEKSLELFYDNFDTFNEEYLNLVKKYKDLIHRALHIIPIDGVNTFPIVGFDPKEIKKLKDPMDTFGRYKLDYQTMATGKDLRAMFSSVHLGKLADQFAITEFLLKKGLTNSLMISTPQEMGHLVYNLDNSKNCTINSFESGKEIKSRIYEKNLAISMDTHDTGSIINLMSTSYFFKGMNSCLNELVKVLKEKSIFNSTLIHITSEFERIPLGNESGSDHNDFGQTSTFISGKIKKPEVFGNIYLGTKELGTIGTAAPVKELERPLNQKDIAETVSTLLDFESPVRRSKSVLKEEKGVIVGELPLAKNIEGRSDT